jgi:hypothetical protein
MSTTPLTTPGDEPIQTQTEVDPAPASVVTGEIAEPVTESVSDVILDANPGAE